LRPARTHARTDALRLRESILPAGTYVAHVIGQFSPRESMDPRSAARAYDAADALNGEFPSRVAATL
jgi:hypothetical protein